MPTAPERGGSKVGEKRMNDKKTTTREREQNDRKILLRGIKVERGERSMGAPGFP